MTDIDDRFDDPLEEQPHPLTPRLTYEECHPLSSVVKVVIAARSHRGRVAANEDHYLAVRLGRSQETLATSLRDGDIQPHFDETGYGMVVADGMGTDGSGAIASRLAISTLAHLALHYGRWNLRVDARAADEIMSRAERFYRRIDERVTEVGADRTGLLGMATTLTAAYSAGDTLFVAHVGHSRAYLFRNGALTQLTRDQTLEQHRNDTGQLAPTEFASHDLRHILTDAIGGHAGFADVQVGQFRLQHDDCVLLCTNGLTDVVNDEHGAAILRHRRGVHEACQALVDLAVSRGTVDNVTVMMARYVIPV